jgi:AAHS family 4-hydroxybenzoate transporter-like MFS transporter
MLWIVAFLAMAVTFLLTSWLPIAFNQGGLSQNLSILALTMSQVGAVAGALIIGRLMDRYNRFYILVGAFMINGCFVLTLSYVSAAVPAWALLTLMLCNGLFLSAGGTPGVNALTGGYFPTHIRSTGIGWTLGAGRIGSLFGIWLGGAMIAAKFNVQAIFLYVTCSSFLCALLILVMRSVTSNQAAAPALVPPQAAVPERR